MTRRILLALGVASLMLPSPVLAVPDGGIELVDRLSGFGPLPFDGVNEAHVSRHALSADGCFVAIESDNDVLFVGDDDAESDIFRINRCAAGHPTDLVSATAEGVPANGSAFSPTISADGRYVAFTTDARNLMPPGATVNHAVVVKDLADGSVEVASRGQDEEIADAFTGTISGDGTRVAFEARGVVDAANADGVANQDDVYVRDLAGGNTYMASVTSTGVRGGLDGDFDISHDGNTVALVTESDLVATDGDGLRDAYIARDVGLSPQIEHVSEAPVPDSVRSVAISGDAAKVAFTSARVWASVCTPAPCAAPFAIDGATAPAPAVESFRVGFPRGTNDEVFWTTNRSVLGSDTDNEFDLYVKDITGAFFSRVDLPGDVFDGDMRMVSHPDIGGVQIPGVAVVNASSLALPGTDGVRSQVFAVADGAPLILSQPADVEPRRGETYDTTLDNRHAVSTGGRFVVMTAYSAGLGAEIHGNFWTGLVLVRDVLTGVTTKVSVTPGGASADRGPNGVAIDASGSRVVFDSSATNLDPGANDGDSHVYVRDLATGTTQLIDRAAGGQPSSDGGRQATISGDGRKVVFISRSPDLPDATGNDHAYIADLETGAITLVDRTEAGVVGNSSVQDADISADGSRVAFVSSSSNLGPGGNGKPRVYVKDLTTGALTWASIPENGDSQLQAAHSVSLSGDGNRVAWVDETPGFGYGSDGLAHVFVRDLTAGTTTLASTGGSGQPGAEQGPGELDADGSRLVFTERIPGTRSAPYLRDLAAGTTTELLPGRRFGAFRTSISPDGHCVALNSKSPDVLATGNPSPDFDHVYLRAIGADCQTTSGPGGGPGGDPGPGAADTTRPVLSDVRMTRRTFRRSRKRTAVSARRPRRGSAFLFTLSEDARTSIAIARARPGRRVKGRCVKPTRARRSRPRCKRYVVRATLTRAQTRQGSNRVAFSGRIGKRKLPAGRYRATLAAVDAAGNRSARSRVAFRIVRG